MNDANNFTDEIINNVNQVIKDAGDRAKEELMGGQNSGFNNTNLAQGFDNVHHDAGIMQGNPNANVSNVFDGLRTDNTVNITPTMPGQEANGVNAYNFSVNSDPMEVNIPGVNEAVQAPEVNVQAPEVNPVMTEIEQPAPTPVQNLGDYQIPNVLNNFAAPNVNVENKTPEVNPVVPEVPNTFDIGVTAPSVQAPAVNVQTPEVTPVTPEIAQPAMDVPNASINVGINNSMPEANFGYETPTVMDNQNIGIEPIQTPIVGGEITNTNDLNAAMQAVNQTPIIDNQQMVNNDINYDIPKKKWPLTIRETILVAIALIGVIVVIIMYT